MVEKFYKVTNETYINEFKHQKEVDKERAKFINSVYNDYGIDGNLYRLSGNGGVDCPFKECEKFDIHLYIEDTKNNRIRFSKHLKKSYIDGMLNFRKSSSVLKDIQNRCIKENVIINVPDFRVGNYFKELHLLGYKYMQFMLSDNLYLMIRSDNVDNITPEQDKFEEIKASEFYIKKEEFECKYK